jgi:hypothetical protein
MIFSRSTAQIFPLMKKTRLLFLVSACLFATLLPAQPVLLASDHTPQLLDSAIRQHYLPSALLPGTAGAGVYWDFSQLQPDVRVDSAEYEYYPSHLYPYHDWQLRRFSESTNPYDYYLHTGDSIAFAGHYYNYPIGIVAEYSDPELLLHFPVHYGDQLSDSFAGFYNYSGYNNNLPTGYVFTNLTGNVAISGSSTSTADAYGTLVLPGGLAYQDVLRIHRQGVFIDSLGTQPYATWSFFAPGQIFPVLVVGDNTPFDGSYVHVTESRKGIPTRAINNPNFQDGFELLGNPVTTDLMRLRAFYTGELEIVDMDGRLIYRDEIIQNDQVIDIPLEGISPGIYVARLNSPVGSFSRKFIKFTLD